MCNGAHSSRGARRALIVLDASAAVEWLHRTTVGLRVERRIYSGGESLHSPHLLDLEVANVLRRFVAACRISPTRGEQALHDLLALRITRYPHDVLVCRIWRYRQNLPAYDAFYVALAEDLSVPLITCDKRLSSATGHSARVEVF